EVERLDGRPWRRRALVGDGDRLLLRVALEQEEAPDHLLRLGERAIDERAIAVAHPHPHALAVGLERLAERQQAARLEIGAEIEHALIQRTPLLLGPRPALPGRL